MKCFKIYHTYKTHVVFSTIMANFEAFPYLISSSISILFLKSDVLQLLHSSNKIHVLNAEKCYFNEAPKNLWINGDLFAVLNLPQISSVSKFLNHAPRIFSIIVQKKKLHLGNYLLTLCSIFLSD